MFEGLPIEASENLRGQGKGVKSGGVLYVSPAFFSLLRTCDSAQALESLLVSLKVIDLDRQPAHDTQWHIDDMQIKAAQIDDLIHKRRR